MSDETRRTGFAVLNDARLNKSTAFTKAERQALKLRGLLPAAICTQDTQIDRALENIRRKESDLERYIFLRGLQARNERLFYRVLHEHVDEIMPLVYTPTVGEACRRFAHIFRQSLGFYLTPEDRGEMRDVLDNWPEDDVRVVVVTDGERILGLGDLGANGMGIPIGKLALYTACAGIAPRHCLPVMLDVGTNNAALREDPLYLGTRAPRLRGTAYDEFVEEFVAAIADRYPDALIQFEDFVTANAYVLLERYRDRVLCFNDDIQGTAVVTLAGLYASTRITGVDLAAMRFMFLGAGSANAGIAALLLSALREEGLSDADARDRIWMLDHEGLLTTGRAGLAPHARQFAREGDVLDLPGALRAAAPHALIGATGAPGSISREAVELMTERIERPVVFALSNPTASAECTAAQAYEWSGGRVIFASGSPFGAVSFDGNTFRPGQANNVYAFPGIGLGAIATHARSLHDDAFLSAARALARAVDEVRLAEGTLYPPLGRIREVSLEVARAVGEAVVAAGASEVAHEDVAELVAANPYEMTY
jgi:malate dehydrogenase (oxaloacetate-decarboxylating)(NADP+)